MNEPNRDDWNELGMQWRSETPAAPTADEIRSRMRAKQRRLTAAWTGDIVVATLLTAYVAYQVVQHPGPGSWLWAAAFAVCLITAFVFVSVNRRGLQPPPSESLTAYISHARRHCRSRRRSIRFAWALYTAELAFMLGFFLWVGLPADGWLLVGSLLGAFTLGLALWTFWFGQWVRAEQRYLDMIEERDSMDGEDPL